MLVSGAALCCYSKMQSGFTHWSDVRIFLAVLRTGSTLGASRLLDVAQPTVSRRIDVLEHVLRLTLFERDTRGFHPTADALHLQPLAEAMEAAAEALGQAAARRRSDAARPIRLTAPVMNFTPRLGAILSEFTEANPGVSFEFVSTYEVVDLSAGDADVAIRITRRITDETLICRKLGEVTSALYAAPSYVAKSGMPRSMEDIEGHRFVLIENGRDTMVLNRDLLGKLPAAQVALRCSDIASAIAAVKSGFGVGALPCSLVRDDPELVRCFPPPADQGVHSWMLASAAAWRRPEVRRFVEFFVPRYLEVLKHTGSGT